MPNNEELLEQAAGVGIEFTPKSLSEAHFLQFCYTLWLHGSDSGMMRFRNALNQSSTNRQPMVEPMV
jgi:hypothetical protein